MPSSTLAQFLAPLVAQNADFAPYWGLLGLKGLDFATGLAKAVAAKDVQPAKLMRTPGAILLITGAVAFCLCLNAISPLFAPIVAVVLAIMGAAEAASIVQNVHDFYIYRGQTPPAVLAKIADTLATFRPMAALAVPLQLSSDAGSTPPPAPSGAGVSDEG